MVKITEIYEILGNSDTFLTVRNSYEALKPIKTYDGAANRFRKRVLTYEIFL